MAAHPAVCGSNDRHSRGRDKCSSFLALSLLRMGVWFDLDLETIVLNVTFTQNLLSSECAECVFRCMCNTTLRATFESNMKPCFLYCMCACLFSYVCVCVRMCVRVCVHECVCVVPTSRRQHCRCRYLSRPRCQHRAEGGGTGQQHSSPGDTVTDHPGAHMGHPGDLQEPTQGPRQGTDTHTPRGQQRGHPGMCSLPFQPVSGTEKHTPWLCCTNTSMCILSVWMSIFLYFSVCLSVCVVLNTYRVLLPPWR